MTPTPSPRPDPDPETPPPAPEPVVGQEIDDHTGATDAQVGDLTGPGAGYDQEPKQEKDKGGVSSA